MPTGQTSYYVDFGATTYDWSLIRWRHHNDKWGNRQEPFTTPEEDNEVAKLCYHACVAAEVGWRRLETVSGLSSVKNALRDHFRYDPNLSKVDSLLSEDPLVDEIRWLRPIQTDGDSHSIIFVGFPHSFQDWRIAEPNGFPDKGTIVNQVFVEGKGKRNILRNDLLGTPGLRHNRYTCHFPEDFHQHWIGNQFLTGCVEG